MPWATIQLVNAVTGAAVTDIKADELARAQMDIENQTGVLDTDKIGKRDLVWLGRAVAYQWAWRREQFDLLTRSDVSTASQDGQSTAWNPHGHTLGPLAKNALKRLSWNGNRTEYIEAIRARRALLTVDRDNGDPAKGWRRM